MRVTIYNYMVFSKGVRFSFKNSIFRVTLYKMRLEQNTSVKPSSQKAPVRITDSCTPPSELAAYSDMFKRLPYCVFLVDTDTFKILDSNPACEGLLQVPLNQLNDSPIAEWLREEDRPKLERTLRIIRHRYYPIFLENHWVPQEGETRTIHCSVCMLALEDGSEVIQVIANDITREKELEAKAERYLESLKEANEKLEELSITDEMTHLPNFRRFMSTLEIEHSNSRRYGRPYSILFCDVDHFKNYNDTHGHPEGDVLLKKIADTLRSHCRETDLPARYGGEEFAILCREVTPKKAKNLAKRICKAIASIDFPHGQTQPLGRVTISIGVAGFPEHGKKCGDVLKAADEALYESKEHGRNRVTVAKKKK